MHAPRLLLVLVLLSGCAPLPPKPAYLLAPAHSAPNSAAVLQLGDADWVNIDHRHFLEATRYGSALLPPGEHRIEWGHTFGFSPLVETRMEGEFRHEETVNVQAGQRYRLRADRTYGRWYRVYFWIEDGNGQVVAGNKLR